MDRIKYGPAFGPKHGSQLMGRPTRVFKILWAFTWAGPLWPAKILWAFTWADPLWPAKSCGPLAGSAHYGPQNLMGL